MSAHILERPIGERTIEPAGFGHAVRSEWIKLTTVRSTWWTTAAMIVLGAGLTALICWTSADWLAGGEADESPGSFITWGLGFAQITAVVLGALAVTSEYGTGMIRSTLAATPGRATVFGAKAFVLASFLLVAGTFTAFLGYFAGNWFLSNEGVGMSLGDDDVLRSMFGSGLYMAGLGIFSASVGLLVRHSAAAISIVLGLVFVVGNMVMLLPGTLGEWATKLMPGNAGAGIVVPVPFNPNLLEPWTGFAVFVAEIALVALAGYAVFRKRDA